MAVLLREAIGGSLRRARTARRRTLRDVARQARVSLGYLSEVERGRKEPSSELLASICDALDLAVPDMLTDAAEAMWTSMAATDLRLRPVGLRHAALRLAVDSAMAPAMPAAPAGPAPVRAAA